MAESSDKPKKKEEKADVSAQPKPQPQQPVQVQVDDSKAETAYANFFRVSGMPEELILDFGLATQQTGAGNQPIPVNLRVVLNYYTAKRMLHALNLSVQRHEATFGVLETDIQKRVQPGVMAGKPGQAPAGS